MTPSAGAALAPSKAEPDSTYTEKPSGIEHPALTAFRWASYKNLPQTYGLFMDFVRNELAPYMEMRLVEEDFYPEMWERWHANKYTIDEIARGHGKSEWGIWQTLYNAVRQPENTWWDLGGGKRVVQQLIVSSGSLEVRELGDRMEEYCFASPILRQLTPRGAAKGRTTDRWNNKKKVFSNGSMLHFRQVKCRRGLHVDNILMDDLITESSTLTDKDTKKFVLGAILPMGTAKRAMVRILGTPLRATDIIHEMEKTGMYEHSKLPAILDWEKKVILSKRLTWDALMSAKKLIGSVKFEAEYQLNALENQRGIIRRSWVEACYDKAFALTNIAKINAHEESMTAQGVEFTAWRDRYYAVYGGVDFAFSDLESADWSVYYTVGDRGEEYDGTRYDLLDVLRFRGQSLGWQMEELERWYKLWEHDLIGVEANSIRSSVKDIRQLNIPFKLFWTGTVDERDKKKPQGPFSGRIYSVSKRNFALRLGGQFERGNIRIPYQGEEAMLLGEMLRTECCSWALEDNKLVEVGIHPDMPIALGYAIETAEGHHFAVG